MDLEEKVRELSRYLTEEAVADALNLTPEAVRDILEGKARVERVESPSYQAVHVSSVRTAYRQKVVSVVRAKGGVGATVISLGLAYLLSLERLKTLLVDLCPREGPGDLSCYLGLHDYPHLGAFAGELSGCVAEVEPDLHVLQLPPGPAKNLLSPGEVIALARQDYDAVVVDLPNLRDAWVDQALRSSTTLLLVTGGLEAELARLASVVGRFPHKEVILLANRCELPPEAEEAFEGIRVFRLEHDGSLLEDLLGGNLPDLRGAFMKGLARVRDALYERDREGVFQALKRRLFG